MKAKMRSALRLIFCAALAAIFSAVPFSASGAEIFRKIAAYPDYRDVDGGAWYYDNVKAVSEYGLMNGKSESSFDPEGNVTVAESVTVAARLHALRNGKTIPASDSPAHWYDPYVRYAKDNGICDCSAKSPLDMASNAERRLFALFVSNALPGGALRAVNRIDDGAVTDVPPARDWGRAVYRLYRAGILTGSSDDGRQFLPDTPIRRAEVAAVLSRVADPSLRRSLTLTADPERIPVLLNPPARHRAQFTLEERAETVGKIPNGSPAVLTESVASVRLSNGDRSAYPALAAWIDGINADFRDKADERWNAFKEDNPGETDTYQSLGQFDGEIGRFTDRVFSFWYDAGGYYYGAAHGYGLMTGKTFDIQSRRELELADAVSDMSAFRSAVKEAFAKTGTDGYLIGTVRDGQYTSWSYLGDADADQMPEPTAWALVPGGLKVEFHQFCYGGMDGVTFILPDSLLKPEYRSDASMEGIAPFLTVRPNDRGRESRLVLMSLDENTPEEKWVYVPNGVRVYFLRGNGGDWAFAVDTEALEITVLQADEDGHPAVRKKWIIGEGTGNLRAWGLPADFSDLLP